MTNSFLRVPYVDLGLQFTKQEEILLPVIKAVLEKGQYILGPEVETFEKRFAELCHTRFAVSVANGTDALILALRAIGMKPGDEVITCSNSWISSASCTALLGGRPVFVDVLTDQTMDPQKLEAAITSKTKAIIPVHLTGKCARMNEILEIARTKNIAVIEDAAQAVGAEYRGQRAGSLGTMGCFSLHPLKNLNAFGDAGIITTHDEALASELKLLRHHGLKTREHIVQWGYNSRLDALQAAILNTKLNSLAQVTEKRRAHANFYRERLKKLVYCPQDDAGCFDVYHLFVIQAPERDRLKTHLLNSGVETAIHYPIPIHLQEAARDLGYKRGDFPMVERQAEMILSLPVHQDLTREQLEHVCTCIEGFYSQAGVTRPKEGQKWTEATL